MEKCMQRIVPFTDQHPLPENVESDHVLVTIALPGNRGLTYYNISNPVYHHYFGCGEQHPFRQTHMNVPKPCDEGGQLQDGLQKKIAAQLDQIVKDLTSGRISVYVIVEGYEDFYRQLAERIDADDVSQFTDYDYVHTHDPNHREPAFTMIRGQGLKPTSNVTAIVFNNRVYEKTHYALSQLQYMETERVCSPVLPWVTLRNRDTQESLLVLGVHLPGCASQYPERGLRELAWLMRDLHRQWKVDVLAVGDYNTPPEGVDKTVIRELQGELIIRLPIPYVTHINPNGYMGVYDHAVLLRTQFRVLPLEFVSPACKSLVQALERNHKAYQAEA